MKKILYFFIILAGAIWLSLTALSHPGTLTITFAKTTFTCSLWLAVAITLLSSALFYFLIYDLWRLVTLPNKFITWLKNRHRQQQMQQTLTTFFEIVTLGNTTYTPKQLEHFAQFTPSAASNYALAAKLATPQLTDYYLKLAYKHAPLTKLWCLDFLAAQIAISQGEWSIAQLRLEQLIKTKSTFSEAILLLVTVYQHNAALEKLINLLPAVRRTDKLSAQQFEQLKINSYEAWLKTLDKSTLKQTWQQLPRALKRQPKLAYIYLQSLITQQCNIEAERLIKKLLTQQLDERLLQLYPQINSAKPPKQLARAEKWQQLAPQNVPLLICLGQLCLKLNLWGKARHYLEASITIKPTITAYLTLAKYWESIPEKEQANNCYRQVAKLIDTDRIS